MKIGIKKFCGIILIFFVVLGFMLVQPLISLDEVWNYGFSKNIADGLVPYRDFNLVQTPLLFFFVGLFLKFTFNELIVTRILGAMLLVAILITMYFVLNKLIKNKYVNVFILLNLYILFQFPFWSLDYNYLVLLFSLLILNYELKDKNGDLLKLNLKTDFIFGIIAGMAIITKQSSGLILAIAYVGYKWLAIRKKEDFITAFKISLSRGIGVLVPITIFFIYLFATNSFQDFWNFCVLGVSEFKNFVPYTDLFKLYKTECNITILSIMVIIIAIYSAIYLIKNFKCVNEEYKNILKLLVFGVASFVVVFPISNDVHFVIGSIILILLTAYIISINLNLKHEKIKNIFIILIRYLDYVIVSMLIVLACMNYYVYVTNYEHLHDVKHYNGVIVGETLTKRINNVNEYAKEQEAKGKDVYIVDASAMLYDIPANRYNKYFGLLLKGNLGKNGVQNTIEKIKSLDDNGLFLVMYNDSNLNWQVPREVINFVKNNYTMVDQIDMYAVYCKENTNDVE